MRLADYTTVRLGGPARGFVRAGTEDELIDAVRAADASGEPVLILGGGSNLVVADEGFRGTVVHVATRGVAVTRTAGGATPIQNVGAYGQEVAQTITGVRVFDRAARRVVTLDGAACGFGYRTSMFK